ncbi:hypothetical protein VPH35_126371 [Triticum aestivum]
MEGQPMVSYTAGSMNSLVDKLTKLKNPPIIIRELGQDLVTLQQDFFDKLARQRETNSQVATWLGIVPELIFDIEDWTDQNPAAANTGYQNPAATVNTGGEQSEIEQEIILKYVMSEREKLRVVSIVGMAGIGKTTLAKEIYAKLQGEFECRAFVTLGRRPSMRKTLVDILHQVKSFPPLPTPMPKKKKVRRGRGTVGQDRTKLLTELWEYLGTKRYFIIVDGLWSKHAWKIINSALCNKNRGSLVLITTCINDVAKRCSVPPTDIYRMEDLSEKKSLYLDPDRDRQTEWSSHYDDFTRNVFRMCGDMPLAITIATGLLTTKCHRELAELRMPIVSSAEQYFTSEGVMKLLQMSYAALSLPLKSCLLYLKYRLIRVWIAEGFIPRKDTEGRGQQTREESISLWETGERYFNELITRRLIQPVFNYNDDQAVGCTVHGLILHFIKSSQGKFVTFGADLSSGLFPGSMHTVRRLSLDRYDDQDQDVTLASAAVHLWKVRSITVLGGIEGVASTTRPALRVSGKIEGTSLLPSFKLIRVLDLEDSDSLRSRHLKGIQGLVLLRHLGVAGTAIDKLPEEIGELGQLETLDLRRTTKLSILPASIAKQKMLAHLLIDGHGFEEVSTIGVDSKSKLHSVIDLMDRSEQLRVLGVRLHGSQLSHHQSVKLFLEKVARSTRLTSLSLDCQLHFDLLGLELKFPPPEQLRRFELTLFAPIPRVAAHKMKSLLSVTHMDIEMFQLDDEGSFSKLVSSGNITPWPKMSTTGRCIAGADGGFSSLKVFSLICQHGGTEPELTSRAMKKLGRLSLEFSARKTLSLYGNFSFGIQHLSSLTRIRATIDCKSAAASEVKNAEYAIREQVEGNFCMMEFSTKDRHMMLPDEANKKPTSKIEVYKFISHGTKWLRRKLSCI